MTQRSIPISVHTVIHLTGAEVETLVRLANYYEKSMGPMRHLVRLVAPAEVKTKYRFVAEESKWLRRFAETTREDMQRAGQTSADVTLTPRALVAFWGRVLASLHSRRSRRRLSAEQVQEREELAAKLQNAARTLSKRNAALLEQELQTRRPIEAGWMREQVRTPDRG